jgi:BirA family biotin operon repressor/biotin-[acetyl-CoA-carboxylase] ligase
VEDFTVVFSENQTNGKGQLGSVWYTNPGENLTFSVYLSTSFLCLKNQFYLNCAVSLSVFNVLKKISIPQLSLKWPNDILSYHKKLAGILIENVISSSDNSYAIIGIGLNVNQLFFDPILKASSLKKITGKHFDLNELLVLLVLELQNQISILKAGDFYNLHSSYEEVLFRKNKPSTFKDIEGDLFTGFIKNVTTEGRLRVLTENHVYKEFNLKEVKLMY